MRTLLRNPSVRIALTNYGIVLGLAAAFGTARHLVGDDASLIALKLFVVPLWYLSIGGLNAIYRHPIVEDRWTVRAVEHAVLRALRFGLLTGVMQWTPDQPLSMVLLGLTIASVAFAAFTLNEVRLTIARRREASSGA